ncbi:MAG: hypothetical protein GY953_03825, partial [bacterium]|nr:hypothetical protein [bacterium]
MPITEKQRQARRTALGSSDIPAILGVSPWAAPKDIWLEKVKDAAPREANEWMEQGNLLEDAVLDWAATKLGR